MSTTLYCSSAARARYGADWSAALPGLRFVTLPDVGRTPDDQLAEVDIAVFSHDLWTEGRGRSFFGSLRSTPHLKWLHMFAAGLDDPVFDDLAARGIRITGSAGSSATPIAHSVMLHVLALCRNSAAYSIAQAAREWNGLPALDLEGRRICIVGLGSIGREVARIAPHFGMEATAVRRRPTGDEPCPTVAATELHRMLPMVDDLVLTAALTPESRNLIGATELALLPAGAHVINVGRGELLDEAALADALRRGHVGGAALDVATVEPLPADHPLWSTPNTIITPHVAGRTQLTADRAAAILTENLGRWHRGEQLRNERGD